MGDNICILCGKMALLVTQNWVLCQTCYLTKTTQSGNFIGGGLTKDTNPAITSVNIRNRKIRW